MTVTWILRLGSTLAAGSETLSLSASTVPSGSSSLSSTGTSTCRLSPFTSEALIRSSRAIGATSGTSSATVTWTGAVAVAPRESATVYCTEVCTGRLGAVMSTRSPETSAFRPSTPAAVSMPFFTRPIVSPSGSESLVSTATATVRPGRMTIESLTAYGAWLMLAPGAIPTRTDAVASLPSRSRTL